MDDCCGRLAAWPPSRRSPVKQPSHRVIGNPPISSAALFAQHARTRRRSKARRRSSARARQPGRDALEHGIQKAHRCRPAEGSAEKALSKEAATVRKCHDGASLQRNRSELPENAARGPLFRLPTTSNPELRPQNRRSQMLPTPNSSIPPAQHARNKAPLWRFLTEEAQEGAVPGSHPPGLSHFPEKSAALFHVEGKTRERRRVRNASPAGKGARHGRANIRMQQLPRGFQQGAHRRGDVDPMPLLRRPIVSVLDHDETGRAEATQSQARNAHRPPKMNEAEHATRPSLQCI